MAYFLDEHGSLYAGTRDVKGRCTGKNSSGVPAYIVGPPESTVLAFLLT
jgi:hypothetical protein